MFKVNDIVVVEVDHPEGVDSYFMLGECGIVTEVDGKEVLVHTDMTNSYGFVFLESELRLATAEEIKAKLVREFRRWHKI